MFVIIDPPASMWCGNLKRNLTLKWGYGRLGSQRSSLTFINPQLHLKPKRRPFFMSSLTSWSAWPIITFGQYYLFSVFKISIAGCGSFLVTRTLNFSDIFSSVVLLADVEKTLEALSMQLKENCEWSFRLNTKRKIMCGI